MEWIWINWLHWNHLNLVFFDKYHLNILDALPKYWYFDIYKIKIKLTQFLKIHQSQLYWSWCLIVVNTNIGPRIYSNLIMLIHTHVYSHLLTFTRVRLIFEQCVISFLKHLRLHISQYYITVLILKTSIKILAAN